MTRHHLALHRPPRTRFGRRGSPPVRASDLILGLLSVTMLGGLAMAAAFVLTLGPGADGSPPPAPPKGDVRHIPADRTSSMSRQTPSLFSAALVGPALLGAAAKLDPRAMIRNPVMFVVEVVAVLTTILFLRDLITGGADLFFSGQIILWLWFTLLFANFAEALAEGRGKAQADSLRRTRTEMTAKRLNGPEPQLRDRCPAPPSRSAISCSSRRGT